MTEITPEVIEAILNGPAMVRPEGVDSDNPHPSNESPIAIAVICLFFATSTMLLRLYARLFVLKTVRVEDFLGLAGFGCYILFSWCYLMFLRLAGFYVHQWNVTGQTMVRLGQIFHTVNIAYGFTMLFLKTAILVEWLQIFTSAGTARRGFFWACRLMIIANVLFYGAALITCFVECIPIERFWEIWRPGHCFNRRYRDLSTGGINIAQDIFILVLPQRIIWSLNMTLARKVGISIMFSVGLLTCAMAIGRLYAYSHVQYTVNLGDNNDTTYTASPTFQWAFGEITCVLLVFTVPWVPRAIGRPKSETNSDSVPERSWMRLRRRPVSTWKFGLSSLFSTKATTIIDGDSSVPRRGDSEATLNRPSDITREDLRGRGEAWPNPVYPAAKGSMQVHQAPESDGSAHQMVTLSPTKNHHL